MSSESVKVIVRCRPMNEREKSLQSKCVVFMDSPQCHCSIMNPNDGSAPQKQFSFDGVYYTDSTTETIYNEIAYPLVEGVLEGYFATVFAYGQTGCGKSFTMQGVPNSQAQKGIIPRAFEHIFEAIETSENVKFLVHAAYLEIYNEDIRDLLGTDVKKKLDLKEHPDKGVYVSELSQHPVHNVEDCENLMAKGWKNRSVASTLMNADSSRSHSIFTIQIEMMAGDNHIRIGKLHLVDLAGSEKISKTGASGDRLKEATKINLSLSALGNVISALVDGKSTHIPYRDSKLTRLLQDSLGGNTKTLMVACVSPSDDNYDETLSTLRYANRAKNIKNKPKINQDPKDALLSEYQEEIRLLKELLEKQKSSDGETPVNAVSPSARPGRRGSIIDLENEKEKIRREYEQQIAALKHSYESEQQNYSKLQANVESLKSKYERELEQLQVEKAMGLNALSPEQQEALARLHEIEENMVGGEKAHDKVLLEKRQKKKKAAERRSKVIEDAISKSDEDDTLLIKAYDSIQEELRVKTDALKKSKNKIRALDREVQDLYSEFQNDRTDYLETIRRQDQQLKLYQGILDKVQSLIRRDCNYSNLDKIRSEALWSEETTRWKLPEVQILKIKLPPAGQNGIMNMNGSDNNNKNRATSKTAPGRLESDNEEDEENNHSVLIKKFEANQHENLTENYFKPKRAAELIIKAQQDASRIIRISPKTKEATNGNVLVNWNNHFNTVQKTQPNIHPTSNSWGPSPVQNSSWPSPSLVNFLSSPEMSTMRRPTKLEALPIQATSKTFKKIAQVSH